MLLTVAELAEAVQDVSEALVHGRQRLQLDLLEVLGTLVLQVAVSLADAAHHCRRLGHKCSQACQKPAVTVVDW